MTSQIESQTTSTEVAELARLLEKATQKDPGLFGLLKLCSDVASHAASTALPQGVPGAETSTDASTAPVTGPAKGV